ncbi:MAG: RNA polymerase sigma factor [Rhodospirillaceae bacterium]
MNDEREVQRFFIAVQPQLRRFLTARFGNEADADDVVQETFIKLHHVAQSENIENVKALAFSIARNLSVDLIRRNTRAKARDSAYGGLRTDTAGEDFVDRTPDAERQLAGRQDLACLLNALETLTPKVRQAFVLHKIDGHSYAEVARLMGLSKSTVEKHMIKALRLLAEALK